MNKRRQKHNQGILHSVTYVIFLLVHIIASFFLRRTVHSTDVLPFMESMIPVSTFTGVLSSIANICLIVLAVAYGKTGFITAFILIIIQFPGMISGFVIQHDYSGLPGIFGNILTILALFFIYQRNRKIESYQKREREYLKDRQEASYRLFEQTATALVNAIDAKDTYSRGHSLRVAEYSREIARILKKDDEECEKIYYAALLHDVGKIGIPLSIINKKGKLTDEEYAVIKEHPEKGSQILSSISEYPYLSIGAHYHHERYDGRGYPDNLKGDDIPELARIISVADAYDAMSSNRSYRDAIPQQLVREEIVKGIGTQFDPFPAKAMLQLIDLDTEYRMREKNVFDELAGKDELDCEAYRSSISTGILLTQSITRIHMKVTEKDKNGKAAMVLFDSLDGRVHGETEKKELCYYEYCELFFDGQFQNKGARKIKVETEDEERKEERAESSYGVYEAEAVKCGDHVQIRISDNEKTMKIIVALPDSSRYAYIGLTGEQCLISEVSIAADETPVSDEYITRIAEKISYIEGESGDLPNLQIDGHRSAATSGVPINDKLKITFHTKSLPTARLVWHCPYYVIFSSKDGSVGGKGYKEYAIIRLDGENQADDKNAENKLVTSTKENFKGWDAWKEENKNGFYSSATFIRQGQTITMNMENQGIYVKNVTTIMDAVDNVFVAVTGDQCAITDIRIIHEEE